MNNEFENFVFSDLVLWDYYTKEELRYGAPYDMEIAGLELQQEEEVDSLTDQSNSKLSKHTLTNGKLANPRITDFYLVILLNSNIKLPHCWVILKNRIALSHFYFKININICNSKMEFYAIK